MNSDMLLNRIRMAQQGLIGVHKKLYTLEHLQSFCPSPKDSAIENDAVTEDGMPILFAYQPDLPKLYRFYAALELHKRSGIIVCFNFQEDALRPFCGSRIKLQTIDFSDFERRFLNSP